HDQHREHRRDSEYREAGCHTDKLCHERKPVHKAQVQEREPAPERPECGKDRLCTAVLSNRAKPYGHLLDKIGDGTEQDQKPDEVIPELCPGCRIRGDTAGIVIRNHHDKTGTGQQQVYLDGLDYSPVIKIESRQKIHSSPTKSWSCSVHCADHPPIRSEWQLKGAGIPPAP